jgi:membrane protein required for colicin V production
MLDGLTGFDHVVLALCLLFVILGIARGLVAESLSLGAFILAAIAVRMFHEPVTGWLEPRTGGEASAAILAFLGLFFGVLLLGRLVSGLARGAVHQTVLGPVDRVAGGAFGLMKAVLLAAVLFMLAQFATGFFDPARQSPGWLMNSRSAPFLAYVGGEMVSWLEEARETGFQSFPGLPEGHPPLDPFADPEAGGPAELPPEPGYSPEDNRRLEELIANGEAVDL